VPSEINLDKGERAILSSGTHYNNLEYRESRIESRHGEGYQKIKAGHHLALPSF
jgi:hypothetical protein